MEVLRIAVSPTTISRRTSDNSRGCTFATRTLECQVRVVSHCMSSWPVWPPRTIKCNDLHNVKITIIMTILNTTGSPTSHCPGLLHSAPCHMLKSLQYRPRTLDGAILYQMSIAQCLLRLGRFVEPSLRSCPGLCLLLFDVQTVSWLSHASI
jgi:hypothetical protein